MGKQRVFLLFEDRAHINISIWRKPLSLAAGVDLEKVELWVARECQAGAESAEARDLMIHVRVNRPMGENDVGGYSSEPLAHVVDARARELGRTIDLSGEERLCPD